jgi:hypothetical protein
VQESYTQAKATSNQQITTSALQTNRLHQRLSPHQKMQQNQQVHIQTKMAMHTSQPKHSSTTTYHSMCTIIRKFTRQRMFTTHQPRMPTTLARCTKTEMLQMQGDHQARPHTTPL